MAGLLAQGCSTANGYDIEFLNDMSTAHLVFESSNYPRGEKLNTDYLIVGGGIAGMSAAYQLREKDFLLFELSESLGGTSSATNYKNTALCHGAHYDLAYPANYGAESLKMLQELEIIYYDNFSNVWNFKDKKYLIPKKRESQTSAHGILRNNLFPDAVEKELFIDLIKSFDGKMLMPTRLIEKENRHLNDISFFSWLQQHMSFSPGFIEGLDYHMKDDYGAGADQVSALAGIHYFTCRSYYTKPVELFSPPEGNFYFINKIYNNLPKERVLTSHLVKTIGERDGGFDVEIINAYKKEVIQVSCNKIIYAGQKHALKYIYPKDYALFRKTEYAPWVVVNIVLSGSTQRMDDVDRSKAGRGVFWQNEIISNDKSLLGFVDSEAQFSDSHERRVLTVYYCFKSEERKMMSLIEERKHSFVERTLNHLEVYFGKSLKSDVEKVFIKQMGHAMPIPKPGYLFSDANDCRSNQNLVYAGVDNGRLPLLFEAVDSGIEAVGLLL